MSSTPLYPYTSPWTGLITGTALTVVAVLLSLVALWLFPSQLPNLSRGPHPVGVMTQHIQGNVDKQTAVEFMLQVLWW